ncbi:MAG: tRNA (adenosine(37)-N6)-threonylcarbamoyltransferase complex ATPase subunit type 1 TsaE [Gammaproteobacteria bacterium]|nr:tRNA (adenosine(37)-N6)-threonylcarbamoyltransferase complex ATPase subunit type 1 TsaE [Gammaproteobacteria bacterium]NIM71763.1 tRNA (adenosine(37)-N6)-threonylcarbamoyltransferase complex ATPase subunit type 1 TsaE [Gammaproteobacteria bacterium]NIN37859.1 tRNA (adenosine(37)-N6)-threonylcarbamoyltransferase complex ATPase subunit type 1 TsaE [Gammaproteobacteria bacterium]NIO23519.1 tRNA (adenosine(37)-N6)-threonylcarbamoyltransferase complex ATPase subunit type 1 TsaE [Gammaproteobacteri
MFLARASDTEALGARLAGALLEACDGDRDHATLAGSIHLSGPLGAGKTTLVRGLVHGLGIEGPVKSPTYTLVEPYARGAIRLYHFDLYRLADAEELEYLGARDAFAGHALCVIEWPERASDRLPPADLKVFLSIAGSGREARLDAATPRGATWLALLARGARSKGC